MQNSAYGYARLDREKGDGLLRINSAGASDGAQCVAMVTRAGDAKHLHVNIDPGELPGMTYSKDVGPSTCYEDPAPRFLIMRWKTVSWAVAYACEQVPGLLCAQ
ncbi:unnamed protein product [Gongylonema pulchrum]|uniref:Lipoprotein n=1 Tax=Gongylonema pulchrum TaxID=637853 RepID=A0A183E8N1_9BILA|nr:unnamed protein product [Gongylonema pulchrum]